MTLKDQNRKPAVRGPKPKFLRHLLQKAQEAEA